MIIPKKEYEKPDSGLHNAILADIIELGNVTTVYQGQTKTFPAARFVWILATLGKDGKPLQVSKRYNVSNFHEKSNVYKDLKMILGAPPNPAADIDNYIGTIRCLWINREVSADGTKDFANIQGYLPADPSKPMITGVPAGFVRDKFRPKTQAGPQGQPVQTFQQVPPAVAAQAAQYGYTPPTQASVASAPAPAPAQAPQYGYTPAPPPQGADVKF